MLFFLYTFADRDFPDQYIGIWIATVWCTDNRMLFIMDWLAQSVWFNIIICASNLMAIYYVVWDRYRELSIMPDQLINVLCTSIPMILLHFSFHFFTFQIDDQLPCYKQIWYAHIKFPMVMYFLHQLS